MRCPLAVVADRGHCENAKQLLPLQQEVRQYGSRFHRVASQVLMQFALLYGLLVASTNRMKSLTLQALEMLLPFPQLSAGGFVHYCHLEPLH